MTLGDGGTYFSLEATCAFAGGKSLVSFLKLKESAQQAITNKQSQMMGQVCGTSIGLSWLFASMAHTSLPDVPKNLEENDFNAHKVIRISL